MSVRIAVVPERLGSVLSPCGSIRLAAFFDAMRSDAAANWEIRYLIPEEVLAFDPDVVVWQRIAMDERQVMVVAEFAERSGALTVYDLDDNLFDLDDEAERIAYADKLKAVKRSLRVADQVWCSTVELADRVSGFSRHRPRVMVNALDPGLWGAPPTLARQDDGVQHLMYMGTRTHAADLALLSQAMDLLEARQPGRFRLDIVGVASEYPERPWMRALQIPSHVGASYPAFVHWIRQQEVCHLGMAPLLASPFNECKSCIKVLDYAALGMPTLASDVAAYRPMQAGVECFKADNVPAQWAAAIEQACDAPALRSSVLARAVARTGMAPFAEAVRLRTDAILPGRAR